MICIFEGIEIEISKNKRNIEESFEYNKSENGIQFIANLYYLEMNLYYTSYQFIFFVSQEYLEKYMAIDRLEKTVSLSHDAKVRSMIYEIINSNANNKILYLHIHSIILKLILYFQNIKPEQDSVDNLPLSTELSDKAEFIKNYIDANFHHKILIEDIAKHMGINRTYVKKWFKLRYKKTIADYITEEKMNIALSLLKEKNYTIFDIANQLNYSNISNFTNAFKKFYGQSPQKLKKSLV